jgi:hypothetical protein
MLSLKVFSLNLVYIGNVFKVIMPATATRDGHSCTCLGHLGQHNRDRIISISVASPKVAKARASVFLSCVVVTGTNA